MTLPKLLNLMLFSLPILWNFVQMESIHILPYLDPSNSPRSALANASLALLAMIADFPEPALPISSSGALDVSFVM